MKISTHQAISIVFLILFMGLLVGTMFFMAGPKLGIPLTVAFTILTTFGARIFQRAQAWRSANPQSNNLSVPMGELAKLSELVLVVMGTTIVTVLLIVVLNVI